MPLNVVIGLVALLVAVITYSVGVWGAFRAKGATVRHLVFLWVGVVFDIVATASMSYSLGWTLGNDLHTYLALGVFFSMVMVAAFGTWGHVKKNDAISVAVAKWAVAPWAMWVGVFVWGMIDRTPGRG
jgi:small basic protein